MDNSSFKEALQLALSRREKAQVLSEACARDLASEAIRQEDYEAFTALYREQMSIAEGELASLRDQARRARAACRDALRHLEADREKLTRRASEGAILPAKANQEHRRLQGECQILEEDIHEWGRLLAADSAEELGGFADLPFDQYGTAKRGRSWLRGVSPLLAVAAVVIAVLVGAVVGPLMVSRLFPGRNPSGALECRIETDGALGEMIRLHFKNASQKPVRLFVPWPASEEVPSGAGTAYGLRALVREAGADDFRDFLLPSSVWQGKGLALVEGDPLSIGPGLSASITTTAQALRDCGVAGGTLQLAVVQRSGERLARYEIDVSYASETSSLAGASGLGVRGTTGRRVVRQPVMPLEEPEPAAVEGLEPAPSVPEPFRPERRDFLEVRFMGVMGENLSLRVATPGSTDMKRLSYRVGDEIAHGWVIESVQERPSALIVRHGASGASATVTRGAASVRLPAGSGSG